MYVHFNIRFVTDTRENMMRGKITTVLQSQTAVTAHLKSEQLLLFDFAGYYKRVSHGF